MSSIAKGLLELGLETGALGFSKAHIKNSALSYGFNIEFIESGEALEWMADMYIQYMWKHHLRAKFLCVPSIRMKALASVIAVKYIQQFDENIILKSCDSGMILRFDPNEDFGRADVIIVDDILRSGDAIGRANRLIDEYNGNTVAVLTAIDAQLEIDGISAREKAQEEIGRDRGIHSITSSSEILDLLEAREKTKKPHKCMCRQQEIGWYAEA